MSIGALTDALIFFIFSLLYRGQEGLWVVCNSYWNLLFTLDFSFPDTLLQMHFLLPCASGPRPPSIFVDALLLDDFIRGLLFGCIVNFSYHVIMLVCVKLLQILLFKDSSRATWTFDFPDHATRLALVINSRQCIS